MADQTVSVIRPGDLGKTDPFTIAIVSNPALEQPWNSGRFVADSILSNPVGFTTCVQYVDAALFGLLPGQAEQLLSDPRIRVISIWIFNADGDIGDPFSFVAEDGTSNLAVARRDQLAAYMASLNIYADLVFAVTGSSTHTRATSWFTTDDNARRGVNFTLDGVSFSHRCYFTIPGTTALPVSASSLTALHEFQHAISSYQNGSVLDLYMDSQPALNIKRGRPIPPDFSRYNGTTFATDPTRDGLGYPAGWLSYHCELIDSNYPSVMDDYWQAPGGIPERCRNDRITRQFILDRISAKMAR